MNGVDARACIEVIMAIAIVICPLALLVHRTIAKKQDGSTFGIGVRTIQLTGVMILPPTLIILALEGLIDGATVAALLGASVGYLFSGLVEFDRRRTDGQ